MKFLVLVLFCVGFSELINADCVINELDIVVTINRQPKSVCSFRNENFYEGRSVRECNIDCTCSVGRLTCCSKSKTHCQRAESCQKVIFDFNTSLYTRSSVICEEKAKTNLVPVYDHVSKDVVKTQVVTIPPPEEVKKDSPTPVKIVETPPENMAQRQRRLNIERIMRMNRARRRQMKLARTQKRKASAKSTNVKKSPYVSKNSKSSQKSASLLDRLRHNRNRRRQASSKKTRVASAQVGTGRAASAKESTEQIGKTAVSKEKKRTLTFDEILKRNRERRNRKRNQALIQRKAVVQGERASITKERKQTSRKLTFEEILKRNRERRNRKRKMMNGGRRSFLLNAMRRNRMRRERLRRQRLANLHQGQ